MRNIIKASVFVASLAVLSVSVFAAPLTGAWHGKIHFDTTKLPNVTDPNQKKLMMAQLKANEQMTMTLTLKADHTYSIVTVGSTKQVPKVNGTWSEAAGSLTIKPATSGKMGRPSTFTVSKDGKSLSFSQGPATVMFFR